MKKFFSVIAALALSASAFAQDANYLYIDGPIECEIGKTVEVTVKMKNEEANIQTIGVYVTLPEGVEIATEDDEYLIELATDRTSLKKHSLAAGCVDGVYRIGILGYKAKPFDGTDGPVFVMTLNVTDKAVEGANTITLSEQELTTLDDKIFNAQPTTATLVATTTAISDVKAEIEAGEVYNVAGQKISAPQRGVNIIGGKKIIVK